MWARAAKTAAYLKPLISLPRFSFNHHRLILPLQDLAAMATTSVPTFIGAVKDEWLMYSDNAEDYTRLSPIGFGASSVVYQAVYHYKDVNGKVKDLPCALKVLNLDKLQPSALRLLTRETQLMSLSKVKDQTHACNL